MRHRRGLARRASLVLCACLAVLGARAAEAQQISAAEYKSPTDVYPHGVLGDDQEWASIRITIKREKGTAGDLFQGHLSLSYDIKAPDNMVFEDVAPRLWDIDGDGKPEVVVVLSHFDHGAQLAVIGYRDGDFSYIAATPTIGQRFRWLAPVGAADLDGDGHIEIGFVHTPHLGKTLHIWRYKDGQFAPIAQKSDLSNHKIGWDHIPGGLRSCGEVPELITASGDWRHVVAARLENGAIQTRVLVDYVDPESLNRALDCS